MGINDKITYLQETKGLIKEAIIEKGVEVLDTDTFRSYADKIREIKTGGTPEVEYIPWEKPEGWPDIKEGIQDNQIRMLVSADENIPFTLNILGQALACDCTIDWGDGSEPETTTSTKKYHRFNPENSTKYVDENGATHNLYVVTVDCRDVRVLNCEDAASRSMLLWYVDSCTPDYPKSRDLSLSSHSYLQCVECIGGKTFSTLNFNSCHDLRDFKYIGTLKLSGSVANMFNSCYALTSLDVSNWDVSKVTSMYNMFNNCYALTSLDVSNWDVGNVTSMSSMFNSCYALTSLDVSNWDVSKVTSMGNAFYNCYTLTSLDVSNWDVGNVTSMGNMFSNCYALTSLDVSNWDVGNLTSMAYLFNSCYALTSLDVSNWDVSNVTSMGSAFCNCYALTDIGRTEWDFSKSTGTSSSSLWYYTFTKAPLRNIKITLPEGVDLTSPYSFPIDVNGYNYSYVNVGLTIPRPTFSIKLTMKYNKLHSLIIKGQDTMKFTASSPQIDLQNTYVFKKEQINEFFTNLPTVTNSPTISLKSNPHAEYADIGIAVNKGWQVLYDSTAQSASIVPLGDEEQPTNSPLVYCFIPEEDGTFVDANGNKCNLLYSQSVATMNPTGWEMLPTFEDALNKYGIEVEEEYRKEIAKDVLAYANDDSLIKRYNIELD